MNLGVRIISEMKMDEVVEKKGRGKRTTWTEKGMCHVQKKPAELIAEDRAYQKLRHLPEYKFASVNENSVCTPVADLLPLNDDAVLPALNALRRVHLAGVIHGDLKNDHVRTGVQGVFFIDFECSQDTLLGQADAYTPCFASLDLLVKGTVHPLDDYEALFMSALVVMGTELPPRPPNNESIKAWLQWKVAIMQAVLDAALVQQHMVLCGLLNVWTTPRRNAWPTDEDHARFVSSTFDVDEQREALWTAFSQRLTRTTRDNQDQVHDSR
jgi:hypothetical protein